MNIILTNILLVRLLCNQINRICLYSHINSYHFLCISPFHKNDESYEDVKSLTTLSLMTEARRQEMEIDNEHGADGPSFPSEYIYEETVVTTTTENGSSSIVITEMTPF